MTSLERHPTLLARPASQRPAWWPARGLALAIVATALTLALGLSSLRGRIIELRYRAAEVLREERSLEAERRELAARVQRLRDPKRLAALARERGFARPERLQSLAPASRPGGDVEPAGR